MLDLLLAIALGFCASAAATEEVAGTEAGRPPTEALDYGLFGTLHLTRPVQNVAGTVLFFSDRDGWTARQDRLSMALAARGAFVVGIDLPTYLGKLAGLSGKCSYPAGHVEEVAHWIERHEGFATYTYPLVVGDGAGAVFAYALAAQAPAGTFAGLVTLGWDATFRLTKEFCAGDAGAMTVAADPGARVVPVAHLPLTWMPKPFAAGARETGWLGDAGVAVRALGALLPPLAARDAGVDLGATFERWRRNEEATRVVLPDDVADLPLTDIPPTKGDAHRIAIIITGDGGWAGLDRGVADALNADGVRVIGFSSLKFFWHKQTPDAAAEAIARVIAHYGKEYPDARFVLIGYSFGASLVPIVGLLKPREHAFAAAESRPGVRIATGKDEDPRRLFAGLPALRPREKLAVHVLAGDFECGDFGQHVGPFVAALAAAGDDAFAIQVLEDCLKGDAIRAFGAQHARQIALRGAGLRGKRVEHARLVEDGRVAARTLLWRITPRVRVFSAWLFFSWQFSCPFRIWMVSWPWRVLRPSRASFSFRRPWPRDQRSARTPVRE